ncbi:TetR/AcrR family transcriptional regulator [Pararhodobacter aggregans]|nr:TetR/AcrR family transcriptional regulator [Pararhodobacter aggregans]PTX03363.1 TetR family transcriptional regulator [Pararhodobacter aggregans]
MKARTQRRQGANATTEPPGQAPARPTEESSRERLKLTALQLFSQSGVDGVSVRDIVSAAQMRNGASVHYYFGSKENLVRELVLESAVKSDARRREQLDRYEREGGVRGLEDVVRMLIAGEVEPDESRGVVGRHGLGHMRFILSLQINNRALMMQAIVGTDVRQAYRQCIHLARRFLPDLSDTAFRNRIGLLYTYIAAALASREAALSGPAEAWGMWGDEDFVDQLVRTSCALLQA